MTSSLETRAYGSKRVCSVTPRAAAAVGNELEYTLPGPAPPRNSGDWVQAGAVTSSPKDSAVLMLEGHWLGAKGLGSRDRLPGFRSSHVTLG